MSLLNQREDVGLLDGRALHDLELTCYFFVHTLLARRCFASHYINTYNL